MTDPKRLIDPDSRSSPRVRALLRVARANLPPEERVAGIQAGVGAFVAGVHGGPTHAGGAATGSVGAGTALGGLKTAAAVKLGAAALVTLGVAGAGYVETRTTSPSGAKTIVAAAPMATAIAIPIPTARATATVTPTATATTTTATPQSPPGNVHPADGDSEITLLDEAQGALASDPVAALSLANRHAARFPRGLLAQEREVIAIEALSRLGRDDEARLRVHRFDYDFPRSAHRPRVDALVGEETSPDNP